MSDFCIVSYFLIPFPFLPSPLRMLSCLLPERVDIPAPSSVQYLCTMCACLTLANFFFDFFFVKDGTADRPLSSLGWPSSARVA